MSFLSVYFCWVFLTSGSLAFAFCCLDFYLALHYMLPQKLTINYRLFLIMTFKSARRDLAWCPFHKLSKVNLCYANIAKMTGSNWWVRTFIFTSAQHEKNNYFTLTNDFPAVARRFKLNLEEKEIKFWVKLFSIRGQVDVLNSKDKKVWTRDWKSLPRNVWRGIIRGLSRMWTQA